MILDIQTQKQLLDEWCWAAVASSISFKYDHDSGWDQARIASHILSSACSIVTGPENAPEICRQGASLTQAMQECTGNFAWSVDSVLTLEQIWYQINNNWPVCCQIYWPATQNAHYIILFGYEGNNIIIGDPQAGNFTQDYDSLVTSYRGGQWLRTYGTQPASF